MRLSSVISLLPPSSSLMNTVEVFERKPFLAVVDILRDLSKPKHPFAILLCEISVRHAVERIGTVDLERLTQLSAVTARRLIGDCVVACLGDRRFVVLLEGPVDRTAAVAIASQLHETMRAPVSFGSNEVCLATSVGIGLGEWYVEPDVVLTRSERALDRVRLNGGDATAVEPPQFPSAEHAAQNAA